jgi:hypothetical protein
MEQGVLLRKMRALNPNAKAFGMRVGESITIYRVVCRIYACDRFREDYLHSVRHPVALFEEPPDDLYGIKRKLIKRPIRVSCIDVDKTHLRQFLDFDRKVLDLYATSDDRASAKQNFDNEIYAFLVLQMPSPSSCGAPEILPYLGRTVFSPSFRLLTGEREITIGRSSSMKDGNAFDGFIPLEWNFAPAFFHFLTSLFRSAIRLGRSSEL